VDIQQEDCGLRADSNNEQVKSRIVYMRDFGSIAPSAKPLVSYLFQALRTRRMAKFYNSLPEGERPLQPTILILGFAETPDIGHDDDDDDSWLFSRSFRSYRRREVNMNRFSRAFTEGGAALEQVLTKLDDKLFTLKSETLPLTLSPFLASFFIRYLVNPSQLALAPKSDFILISVSKPTTDLTHAAVFLSVFPIDSHSNEFRKVEQYSACRRKLDVRNAWLTVFLGHRGASVCEDPFNSIHDLDAIQTSAVGEKQPADALSVPNAIALFDALCESTNINSLIHPIALCRIATMALGFSTSQTAGSATDMPVSQAAISKACQVFVQNSTIRSDWWKKAVINREGTQKEAETRSKKAEEEEIENDDGETETVSLDPIVKKVQESDDLSRYEKRLLSCIVNGGQYWMPLRE
jgi:hypothetical protein